MGEELAAGMLQAPAEGSWSPNGYEVRIGDVDGQNGDDLIWNNVVLGTSRTFVGLSDGAGGFTYPAYQDVSVVLSGGVETFWIADMNGDPYADIVLNHLRRPALRVTQLLDPEDLARARRSLGGEPRAASTHPILRTV